MSDEEVGFLTQKDSTNEDAVKSLWHDKLKLMVVTDGEKGCRYYTKVYMIYVWIINLVNLKSYHSL